MECRYDEVAFSLPAHWKEERILALLSADRSIIFAPQALRAGDGAREHAQRKIARAASRLPGFQMRSVEDVCAGGASAVRAHFAWTGSEAAFEELLIVLESTVSPASALVITLVAPAG